MNYFSIVLAFVLLATCAAGPYGWPDSYERFLERQGVWDLKKHQARADYRRRSNFERDLKDLFEDWKRQTRWGKSDYRSNRFDKPSGGFSRYGFPNGK